MPDSNLDLEALEPHHRGYCALFTNPLVGDCTCDWPATLAALERAARVEAALVAVRQQEREEDWFPEDRPISLVHLAHLQEPNLDCTLCGWRPRRRDS